ncbi:MAG TPA: hypothetical protein PKH77_05180 [Anaerolineae bacterium]|nr:hypothetical protein [Anaerolineae bacterium]
MTNGRLRRELLVQTTRAIRDDHYVYARVFRGRRGAETAVASFNTRIVAVSSANLSRDMHAVVGDAAPQAQVLSAPAGIRIQKGDEVWAEEQRYRVIAVDSTPGAQQVLVQSIQ